MKKNVNNWKRWTTEEENELRRLKLMHLSDEEIGRKLGRTRDAIQQHRDKKGIEISLYMDAPHIESREKYIKYKIKRIVREMEMEKKQAI